MEWVRFYVKEIQRTDETNLLKANIKLYQIVFFYFIYLQQDKKELGVLNIKEILQLSFNIFAI